MPTTLDVISAWIKKDIWLWEYSDFAILVIKFTFWKHLSVFCFFHIFCSSVLSIGCSDWSIVSWKVGFTGNYNEYFGFATDVDAVVYLMLVNDLIHGLFPEAIAIGEDVSLQI